MKRFITHYLVVICVVLSMSSCVSSLSRKVSIEGYDNLKVMGLSGVKTDIKFRNESSRNIEIKSASLTLKERGDSIATFTLKDELEIPKRTELIAVPTIWRMHSVNFMAALLATKQIIGSQDLSSFRVDIKAQVKAGGFKRTLEQHDVRLSDIMK